jgi:beta-mannosidase
MTDKSEELLSENKYLLLLANEEIDLQRLRVIGIGQEAIDKKEKYGSHNYLRHFEGVSGIKGVKQVVELAFRVKRFNNK